MQVEGLRLHPDGLGDRRHVLHREPVGAAPGAGVERVAHVEQRGAQLLDLRVGHVDEPRRDEGAQVDAVAQASPGLLEVGHRGVGQPARALEPLATPGAQVLDPGARLAAPVGQHVGAQREDEPSVAGHRPRVEHAHGGAVVLRCRGAHLHGVADGVVERDARVPQRVPERLGDLADPVLGHGGGVQQDDVEVAGRRELASPVATDRDGDQARGVGPDRRRERVGDQAVGVVGPAASVGGGARRVAHGTSLPHPTTRDAPQPTTGAVVGCGGVGREVRGRPRRSRRCARAPPSRRGRPTPCRRRSCRSGRLP